LRFEAYLYSCCFFKIFQALEKRSNCMVKMAYMAPSRTSTRSINSRYVHSARTKRQEARQLVGERTNHLMIRLQDQEWVAECCRWRHTWYLRFAYGVGIIYSFTCPCAGDPFWEACDKWHFLVVHISSQITSLPIFYGILPKGQLNFTKKDNFKMGLPSKTRKEPQHDYTHIVIKKSFLKHFSKWQLHRRNFLVFVEVLNID
jgi:hypothetical protein